MPSFESSTDSPSRHQTEKRRHLNNHQLFFHCQQQQPDPQLHHYKQKQHQHKLPQLHEQQQQPLCRQKLQLQEQPSQHKGQQQRHHCQLVRYLPVQQQTQSQNQQQQQQQHNQQNQQQSQRPDQSQTQDQPQNRYVVAARGSRSACSASVERSSTTTSGSRRSVLLLPPSPPPSSSDVSTASSRSSAAHHSGSGKSCGANYQLSNNKSPRSSAILGSLYGSSSHTGNKGVCSKEASTAGILSCSCSGGSSGLAAKGGSNSVVIGAGVRRTNCVKVRSKSSNSVKNLGSTSGRTVAEGGVWGQRFRGRLLHKNAHDAKMAAAAAATAAAAAEHEFEKPDIAIECDQESEQSTPSRQISLQWVDAADVDSPSSSLFDDVDATGNECGSTSKGSSHAIPIQAEEEMCAWMFNILIGHLERKPGKPPPPASVLRLSAENVCCPLFVTWMKKRKGATSFDREDVDLRGCIGSLTPVSILELGEYALTSALKDKRFRPISLREVPYLKCHVSLLHSYEEAENALDWEVGIHGTTIRFVGDDGETYTATYLPEIARELEMSQEEAVASLVKKSGYGGLVQDDFSNISLTRYRSSQARLDYDSYVRKYGRYKHTV